jgi:hypothetical protein
VNGHPQVAASGRPIVVQGTKIGLHLLIGPEESVNDVVRAKAIRMLREVAEQQGGLELDEASVLYENRHGPSGLERLDTPEAHSSLTRWTAYAYPKGMIPG